MKYARAWVAWSASQTNRSAVLGANASTITQGCPARAEYDGMLSLLLARQAR